MARRAATVVRRLAPALGLALVSLAAAPPVGAQPAPPEPEEPPARVEPVVVTVTRLEQKADDVPASVTVLGRQDISQSPYQAVDDLLRQVPGFSLFRRTSSLVSHPTTQGVSLRGIGPSGTSRALVLLDGVPINDPFGGWVYWDKIPLQSIEQIEVVRGGGASVWGNYALSGVINIITRRPTERGALLDVSYGNQDTLDADLLVTEARGPLRLSLEGSYLQTDGYPVVSVSRRGNIDIDAYSRHSTFNGRTELLLSRDLSFFLRGTYYDEARGNGTRLQFNGTDSGSVAGGGRLRTPDGSDWAFTAFADLQTFHSTFSSQAPDRDSETLALDQRVPSTAAGGGLQWSRRLGLHRLLAGTDLRWVEGKTEEDVYSAGAFLRSRVAGGQQLLAGAFVQDIFTPHPRLELVGGVRLDYWWAYDGFRRDTPPAAGVPASQTFGDRDEIGVSPRLAALFRATPSTALRASAYQGFRVPTMNELYRGFRVRNDVTVANPGLKPERLTGGELGLQHRWGPLEGRTTGFWNDVADLVANVTVSAPLPDCPPGTTCRQRQNLDLATIRGFETELELRLGRDWRIVASHTYTDARVTNAPQQPGLEGKRLAQVPEHTASLSVRYEHPAWFSASMTVRYVGQQWEDDLNTLSLGSYTVVDLFLSRRITRWGEAYLGIQNLFDTTYSTGRTSDGVVSIGPPFLAHGGIRLTF